MDNVYIEFSRYTNTSGIDFEGMSPIGQSPVETMNRDSIRIKYGTCEGATLNMSTLIRDGDLPNASFVWLEYGTVTFVYLLQWTPQCSSRWTVGSNEDVFGLWSSRSIHQHLN